MGAFALFSFAGVWEIDPHGLPRKSAPRVEILDVREEDEFTGPLGHVAGATAESRSASWSRARREPIEGERRLCAVCRAGSRSAQATVTCSRAGFRDIANLNGGMLRWRAEGYPVEGGSH